MVWVWEKGWDVGIMERVEVLGLRYLLLASLSPVHKGWAVMGVAMWQSSDCSKSSRIIDGLRWRSKGTSVSTGFGDKETCTDLVVQLSYRQESEAHLMRAQSNAEEQRVTIVQLNQQIEHLKQALMYKEDQASNQGQQVNRDRILLHMHPARKPRRVTCCVEEVLKTYVCIKPKMFPGIV